MKQQSPFRSTKEGGLSGANGEPLLEEGQIEEKGRWCRDEAQAKTLSEGGVTAYADIGGG